MRMVALEVLRDQIGLGNNVIIEEKDNLALANRDAGVSRGCSSRFRLLRALPVMKTCAKTAQQLGSLVTAVIVHHHNFKILKWDGLGNQTLQRTVQFSRTIPRRNNDAQLQISLSSLPGPSRIYCRICKAS